MKICIDKSTLVSAIDTVSKAAPAGRSITPILNGVLLEAADGKLNLTRNNLEIAIKHTVDCEILEAGNVIVDAKFFSDVIRKMPEDEEINISSTDAIMSLDAGKVHMEIPVMQIPINTFPGLPLVFGETKFIVENLREMVESVSFAVCEDDERPIYKGILIASKAGTLDMVALDGRIMGVRREKADIPDISIIPMGADLEVVAKLFDKNPVEITVGENKMSLSTPDTQAVIRTVGGQFMDYTRAIPSDYTTTAKIIVKELQQAIERSLLFVKTENGRPTGVLIISVSNDKIALSLKGDTGTFDETLKLETDGEDIRIGFNPMMLAACLKHVEDKEALMKFTNSVGPCIISPLESDKYTYIVLPVRI